MEQKYKGSDILAAVGFVSVLWIIICVGIGNSVADVVHADMVRHHSGYYEPTSGQKFTFRECGPLTLNVP